MKIDVNTIVSPLPSDELLNVVENSLRITFPEPYREFIKKIMGLCQLQTLLLRMNMIILLNDSYTLKKCWRSY